MIAKKYILTVLCILVLSITANFSFSQALTEKINIGTKISKWNDAYLVGVKAIKGKDGSYNIVLEDRNENDEENLDLLIDFDINNDESASPVKGDYKLLNSRLNLSKFEKQKGKSSGKFYTSNDYISLEAGKFAWFNEKNNCKSFTIEFWINPQNLFDGQIIFEKIGPNLPHNKFISPEIKRLQNSGIRCYLKSGRIYFSFINFFHDIKKIIEQDNVDNSASEKEYHQFDINSHERLKAKEWTHIALTYNDINGKMMLYVNGEISEFMWCTIDKTHIGRKLIPFFKEGEESPLVIGKNYSGYIDEFKVVKENKNTFNINSFTNTPGYIISKVFDLGSKNSTIKKMKLNSIIHKGSGIKFEYRINPVLFGTEARDDVVKWNEFNYKYPEIINNNIGRYFQFRITLYPSYKGEFSPEINNIYVEYEKILPPGKPKNLIVKSESSKSILSWNGIPGKNISGYKIYYGTEPGNYLSTGTPIYVPIKTLKNKVRPTFIIENLQPYKIYYFSVTAYDKYNQESDFSKEVMIRINPFTAGYDD